ATRARRPPSAGRAPSARAAALRPRSARGRRAMPRSPPRGRALSLGPEVRENVSLGTRHVLREVDLGPGHPVGALEPDGDAREERRVHLLVLDAGPSGGDLGIEERAEEARGVGVELEETDRLAGELVAGRAATDDAPDPAVAHEEHLLLAGVLG